MPLIEWTAALETGHPVIDQDHRALVELLNRFDAENQADTITQTARLDQLAVHSSEHFRREEQMMAATSYKNMARHMKEHRYLNDELHDCVSAFRAGRSNVKEVSLFFRSWLIQHIANSDQDLANSLTGYRESISGKGLLPARPTP